MTTMKSRRGLLLGTSLFAGMAVASAASAQTASPPAANTLQEIVVTGSRIPRPNLEQATPVAVVSQTVIQQAGPQNLGDVIAELPAVGPTNTIRANSNNFANSAGVSSVDLRNLGTSRTLVLVDGQRHVNGDLGSNAVDLNSIPTALVDRVEITTGGASAIYGSDAVSGVVNIILKKRFEGFQFDAQGGGYDEGFGQKYSASFTAGRTFLDDRLNVAVTGFWHNEAGVDARNLPKAHNFGTIVNPNDVNGAIDTSFLASPSPIRNDNIPDRLFVPNVGTEFVTENGALISGNLFAPAVSFDSHGNPIPVPVRSGFNSLAFGQFNSCVPGACFFPEEFEQETSPNKGGGVDVRANFDWTPHLHANLDAKFVQNNVGNVIQPSFTFGDFLLSPDNAFITPAIRTAIDTNIPGFETFDDVALIGEFLNGARAQDIRRRTYRLLGGLNGDFDAGFAKINWDGELNYGRSENRITNTGLRILNNFSAAIDSVIDPATGQPACRINVPSAGPNPFGQDATGAAPGCVPFNPFGPAQNSAAAFAYSFGTFGTKDTLSQEVASLNANFDSSRFFNLQGGPIGVAVGAEYRMERTKEVNDPALITGLTENAATPNSSGGYNVKEAYVEVNLPVFKDFRPFIQELSVDAAFRGANYSTVGSVSAYKFSGTYAPVSWLKFRSTYSRAIRAPNITEAFLPVTQTFFNGTTDPCSAENIGANVNFAHNCAAAGIPPGFIASTNAGILGQTSGNPNLLPEKSISYTGGIVFQPPVVPGLAITLDYYSIKIKNAINQVSGQDIINNCFGGANLDPTFCSLFTRGPDKNINFVQTTFVNSSKLLTTGFELQVNYATDVAPLTSQWSFTQGLDGRLTLDLTADYVQKLRDFPFQNDPANYHVLEGVVNNNLSEGTPHLRAIADTTYKQGPASVTWQVRYVGRGAIFNTDPSSADRSESTNHPYAPARFYHDVSVRYALDDYFGQWGKGAEVFVGVNNLFGEQDPFFLIGTGQDLAYDLGRFMYAGVRIRR